VLAIEMLSAIPMSKENFVPRGIINVASPIQQVYENSTVMLEVYAPDIPACRTIYYSVDGHQAIKLMITNVTTYEVRGIPGFYEYYTSYVTALLKDLQEGNHTLKVYYTRITDYEVSSSVNFTIAKLPHYSSPSPSSTADSDLFSNQTFLISIVSLVVIIVVSVLFVCYRRRKGKP
jgi:hypothetical protein